MKVRIGFVTNSSSTSYLLVGITDEQLMQQVVETIKPMPAKIASSEEWWWSAADFSDQSDLWDYWKAVRDELAFRGLRVAQWLDDGEPPHMIGYEAKHLLMADETFSAIRQRLIATIREHYGVDIPPEKITLEETRGNY